MKRIAIVAVMLMLGLGAGARSIHYFTFSQASRTVSHLNRQSELMIYCGYDYEIETYVLVNEVWMERVNSAYYEIWLYGFDAYTGEEIYMPLDLQCVWLYSAGRMYNAAQYLRFRVSAHTPAIAWRVPPYNPFTRRVHRTGYTRTYHYDVHRHGWMPPTRHHGDVHPYYMRDPRTTPPMPENKWTPGVDRPKVTIADRTRDTNPATGQRATQTTRSVNTVSGGGNAPSAGRATGTSRSTSANSSSRSTSATSTTPTKATSTTRSTSATPSTSRSTSAMPTSPTKATSTTRSSSVTPATPVRTPSTTRSSSVTPATPTKATSTTRSTSATPTQATNTTRSTSVKH